MASIGQLAIKIVASTAGLSSGLAKATASIAKFGAKAAIGVAGIGSVFAGSLLAGVKAVVDELDHFGKVADRTGASLEGLAGLKLMAGNEDIEFDDLATALTKMNKAIGEANAGSKQAELSFKRLGLDAGELADMKAEDAFGAIADAISELESPAARTVALMDIFGKSGAQLAPLMEAGSEGIAKATEEAKRLGLVVDEFDMAQVAKADDAFDMFQATLKGIWQTLAVQILPVVTALMDKFQDTTSTTNWGDVVIGSFRAIAKIMAYISEVWRVLQIIALKVAEIVVKGFGYVVTALEKVLDIMSGLPDWLGGDMFGRAMEGVKSFRESVDETADSLGKAADEKEKLMGSDVVAVDKFFDDIDKARKNFKPKEEKKKDPDAEALFNAMEKITKLRETMASPLDKFLEKRKELEEMKDLLDNMDDGPELFARAMDKAKDELREALGVPLDPLEKFSRKMEELENAADGGLFDELDEGWDIFRKGIEEAGKELKEALGIEESPLQKYEKKVEKLREALAEGMITPEEYAQGLGKALEEAGALQKQEIKSPEAALAGTSAAASAIARFRNEQKQDPFAKVEQGLERVRKQEEKNGERLRDIANKLVFEVVPEF